MANYATNLFRASTENQQDLDRIGHFLETHFGDCNLERDGDSLNAEFFSKWDYPEKQIDEMLTSLESKSNIYIRVLTHELSSDYVSFRVFSDGYWKIKI